MQNRQGVSRSLSQGVGCDPFMRRCRERDKTLSKKTKLFYNRFNGLIKIFFNA
jgi:hypothetical protein